MCFEEKKDQALQNMERTLPVWGVIFFPDIETLFFLYLFEQNQVVPVTQCISKQSVDLLNG